MAGLKGSEGAINVDYNETGRMRGSVRSLRIREDKAKYLYNLDLDSALYAPKTRSMRENPNPGKSAEDVDFAGDNYGRFGGDAKAIYENEKFVSDARKNGNLNIADITANPSQAELLLREYKEKAKLLKISKRESILSKYGGDEHFTSVPDPQLLRAESETYQEFNAKGQVIKGPELLIPSSKYREDLLESNHTQIWGSYWSNGEWGYACCQQTQRAAYCLGVTKQTQETVLGYSTGKGKRKAMSSSRQDHVSHTKKPRTT